MKHLFDRFRNFFSRFWNKFFPEYRTKFVKGDLPSILKRKVLYVVQEDDFLWHASMVCPCGCREQIHMNLLPDERPCWKLKVHSDQSVSLSPSVWRKVGCKSHFWFRLNKIHWCYDQITS